MSKMCEDWKPENLKKAEKTQLEISDINELNLNSDFGSYRRVRLTGKIADTLLSFHNDLHPLRKIRSIDKLLNLQPKNILDVGCGIGFTTSALAKFYKTSNVLGVDISYDAIEYAKSNHKNAIFVCAPLSPITERLGLFDLICCFEFYPFSRNIDYEYQSRLIHYFSEQLSPNGIIVIYQLWENETSLSSVIDKVIAKLPTLKFSIYEIENPRLTQYLPVPIARLTGALVERILKRKFRKTVVLISHKK